MYEAEALSTDVLNMTNCILFLAQVLLCCVSICQPQKLPRSYTATLEKTEATDLGLYFVESTLRVSKYNRTTAVLNGTFHIIKDIPEDTIANLISYQRYGTEYKRSMIQVKSVRLCDLFATDQIILPDLRKVSNLPSQCPITKGDLYIKNYVVNEDHLPEVFPGDHWRFDVILSHDDEVILHRKIYIRFDHKVYL